ncbi:MAG: acetate kinase [Bryobacterales bacterium]|nr:acetate kinase [Bryobacterales bacterium]
MQVLVINSGSYSIKFQRIETSAALMERDEDRVLARGEVDRVGAGQAVVSYERSGEPPVRRTMPIPGAREAFDAFFRIMREVEGGKVSFDAAGHRIVHGGAVFTEPALLDETSLPRLEQLSELAPLHNPAGLRGYYALRQMHPEVPQVAVFDTAFHSTLPPCAYRYAIPERFLTRDGIRRYGFHGTSHRYVSERYARLQGGEPGGFRLISCHLGSGCSITAIDGGRSVDTTMGFTPLEGLVMGTRSGDIDPAIIPRIMEREGKSAEQVIALLNHESGVAGLSGLANDMRLLMQKRSEGHAGAKLAVDVFCHRIRKYVGAYYAELNGADALIFTAGVGENQPEIRRLVCESLDALGIVLDVGRNASAVGCEAEISAEGARTKVWVVPAREELVIARDTVRCLKG